MIEETEGAKSVLALASAIGIELLPEDLPAIVNGFEAHRRRVAILLDADLADIPPATTFTPPGYSC